MRKLINKELGRLTIEAFKQTKKIPLVVVLDNIRSANNVGSIFRTADSFGIEQLLLVGFTPTPPNRDIHKTALGASESVDWMHFENMDDAIDFLKQKNYAIYAIEQTDSSIALPNFDVSNLSGTAFVMGNEVDGVGMGAISRVDGCIEIPQFGTKHSLNVSVCAGIVVWDFVVKYKF